MRTEVQRAASSVVGRDFVQVLTDIPEAVESSRYVHSGDEVGERLAGTVELRLERGTVLALRAGDGFLVPPGVADPRNLLSR